MFGKFKDTSLNKGINFSLFTSIFLSKKYDIALNNFSGDFVYIILGNNELILYG